MGLVGASRPNRKAGHRVGGPKKTAEFWPHLITHGESEADIKHQRSEDIFTERLAGLAHA